MKLVNCAFFISIIINPDLMDKVKSNKCKPIRFDSDSIVCVCNATYCDDIPRIASPKPKGQYVLITSTMSGLRFFQQEGRFFDGCPARDSADDVVNIDSTKTEQTILGFGGSITDSAGVNINKLSEKAQDQLIASYYSQNGIEYTMGRIPMGATDFSTGPYSYAEVSGDIDLAHFQLKTYEDYHLKIPILKKAMKMGTLHLIASPWTCPFWMKTNNNYAFMGTLKHKYYQTYADYYIKFLESYSKAGVPIWGITTGNEPSNGFWPLPLPILGWYTEDAAKWVRNNLGPTIRKSRFNDTKIIIHDDQKLFLPHLIKFFQDDEALRYVDGVGVHWYLNKFTPKNFLNFAKTSKKDLFIIGTEATNGFLQFPAVELGSWSRAERYIDDIFDDLEYGAAGWIDWNIALDMYGGPVYTHFHADSTIIINAKDDEFYKQPTFYAMGHFSKFLPMGTVRVLAKNTNSSKLRTLAFKRPDDGIVVVVYNKSNKIFNIIVKDLKNANGCATVKVRAKSLNSLMYW